MARPSKNRPLSELTSSELAAAAGISPRNLQLLEALGMLPTAQMPGRGGARSYSFEALKFAASLGGMVSAGLEVFLAARLLLKFSSEVTSQRGLFPSNVDEFLVPPHSPPGGHWPFEVDEDEADKILGPDAEFWIHHFLKTRAEAVYKPGQALYNDEVLILADRAYAFRSMPGMLQKGRAPAPDDMLFRIVDWRRGDEAEIIDFISEVGNLSTPEGKARLAVLSEEFAAAYRNAVGMTMVNLSLAIRNALDRLSEMRGAA